MNIKKKWKQRINKQTKKNYSGQIILSSELCETHDDHHHKFDYFMNSMPYDMIYQMKLIIQAFGQTPLQNTKKTRWKSSYTKKKEALLNTNTHT